MLKVLMTLAIAGMPAAASAAIVALNFSGVFTGSFSSPLVPNGTAFSGSLAYDSEAPATTTNMFDKRYSFTGPLTLTIGADNYSGPFTASASKSPFGLEGIGFDFALPSAAIFTLRFNNLSGVVFDLELPSDPASVPGFAITGISTAQMQGNFGSAQIIASAPAAGVPEAATWLSMLAGFGLVGAGLRSARRQGPAARLA